MNRRLVRALLRLYPARWRRRYAAEFSAFLEQGESGILDVVDIVWAALREHTSAKGERMMNRSEHSTALFPLSCVAALAGGINLVMTVDDSSMINAMRSHLGMSVAWTLLAAATVLSGVAGLSIVFFLYRSMVLFALATRHRDIIALLSVPFVGAGVLLLWGGSGLVYTGGHWVASPWAILADSGTRSSWPSLHTRWICGIISVVLCIVVAAASAFSVQQAIRRTKFDVSNRTCLPMQRFLADFAKLLVPVCTVVMFLSVLAWGSILERSAPYLFQQRVGLLGGTAATSWGISLGLFALASLMCLHAHRSLKDVPVRESL